MNTQKFEIGKSYGNDLTIEVISRTDKSVTIKSLFGTQRIKVRNYGNGVEALMVKSFYILATEAYNFEEAREISMYNAYYR